MPEPLPGSTIDSILTIVGVALGGAGVSWLTAFTARKTQLRQQDREDRNKAEERDDALWDRKEAEVNDLRGQLREAGQIAESAKREADRWEWLARWWFRRAHNLAHALLSARWAAITVLEAAGKHVPETWQEKEDLPDNLPPLEAPKPGPPAE